MPYKILKHTADVRLKVEAKTMTSFFKEALSGMNRISKAKIKKNSPIFKRKISIESSDKTALLVDFLNEVLSLNNIYKETYTDAVFNKISENFIEAELEGRAVEEFGEDIKAATYHEADVKQNKKGNWETIIVFDI